MKVVIGALFFFLLSSGVLGKDLQPQDLDLKHVVVIYRHGDRTPIKPYPNDPYKDENKWDYGFGQLTVRGMRMQYNLGRYLRSKYDKLLPTKKSSEAIYVRSTDIDRTLASAESNLAGLFPVSMNDSLISDQLYWKPVPVHTVPIPMDNLLSTHAECPRKDEALDEVMRSPEMKELNEKYKDLYEYLTEKSGEKVADIVQIDYIYDTLFIEQLYNKTLPDWTKKVFPHPMKYLRDLSFKISTWTHELKRLTSGVLIQSFFDIFQGVLDGSVKFKMTMYSGHDTTLSSLLNSLGFFEPPIAPPYASMISLELYTNKISQTHYVSMQYRNDSTRPPYNLTLKGCEQLCELTRFDALTKDLRPLDWKEECHLGKNAFGSFIDTMTFHDKENDLVVYITTVVMVILFLCLFISVSVKLVLFIRNKEVIAIDRTDVKGFYAPLNNKSSNKHDILESEETA